MSHRLLDYRPVIDVLEDPAIAPNRHAGWSDARELRQAADLLERADEGALEPYLVEMVGRGSGGSAASRQSGGVRTALARILGRVGRPLLRQSDASQRASAGRVFGLELEGLSPEDQAFEVARHFARFATDAARHVSRDTAAGSPHAIASRAVIAAAKKFSPACCRASIAAAARPRVHGFSGGAISSSSTSSPVSRRPGSFTSLKEPVMHDIDRTQMEYADESFEYGADEFESDESEWSGEYEMALSEADEYELANELLNVESEEELDQFLGKLIKRIGKGARKLIRSPIGRAVGGVLKGVAKKALPLAGDALGGFAGGPLGAKIGSGVASAADDATGLELESMEQDEQEFEGAKQFIRLAADTVKKAAAAAPGVDPRAVAQAAAIGAARKLAPGLLKNSGAMAGVAERAQSGRWTRSGNKIVLHGA